MWVSAIIVGLAILVLVVLIIRALMHNDSATESPVAEVADEDDEDAVASSPFG